MCVYMRFGYRASRPHGCSPKGSSVGERLSGKGVHPPRAEARSGVKSLPAGGAAYLPRTGRACADRRERRCTSRGAIKHNAQLCQRQRGAVRGVCRSPGITAIMFI